MEFHIFRTSLGGSPEIKPCPFAYLKEIEPEFGKETERWYINVRSLRDLIRLFKSEGNLIIRETWNNEKALCIEIYDDYRE